MWKSRCQALLRWTRSIRRSIGFTITGWRLSRALLAPQVPIAELSQHVGERVWIEGTIHGELQAISTYKRDPQTQVLTHVAGRVTPSVVQAGDGGARVQVRTQHPAR
ncbi:MAG: hypothetical protein ACT443_02815 [Gemmatimonadota bacterium]